VVAADETVVDAIPVAAVLLRIVIAAVPAETPVSEHS
jgi:hypothetical protein